jgi:general secretion pathway protein G
MTPAPRRRIGFTLVELLVVITIIGVLIALLVPVVFATVGRANDARVAAEINTLAGALASFKNKFQEYPPSRIMLVEDGGFDIAANPSPPFLTGMTYASPQPTIGGTPVPVLGTPDLNYGALAQRSISFMRKLFPKAPFVAGAAASGIPGGFYDINGNGINDDANGASPILLDGHECLVFFLGGIPTHTQGGSTFELEGVEGFSANPRNPFQPQFVPSTGNQITSAQTRVEPFFEFDADRLVDDDFDGVPGYIDPLGKSTDARYFAYFSSYGGSGYDPNDVNLSLNEPGNAGNLFSTSFPLSDGTRRTTSPLPNPYTSSLPVAVGEKPATFHNAQSFQIISAGRDRNYGPGGQYTDSTNGGDRLTAAGGTDASRERDNITNFSNGTLD